MDRELIEKFIEVTGKRLKKINYLTHHDYDILFLFLNYFLEKKLKRSTISGETEDTAIQYLTIADGNVEHAITLMFEGAPVAAQRTAPADEPEVRAPISPTQEILVPEDPMYNLVRAPKSVFDRFRDFSVEIRNLNNLDRSYTTKILNRAVT